MASNPDDPGTSRLMPPPRRVVARPESSLPPGYIPPASAMLKGYQPPRPDLQRSGALARQSRQNALTRSQLFTLAIAAGVVLIVVLGVVYWFFGNTSSLAASGTPDGTVRTYFAALSHQDYTHAYALLSPAAAKSEVQSVFVARNQQLDKAGGIITAFTILTTQTQGNRAVITVNVQRQGTNDAGTNSAVQLSLMGGKWYIDVIAATALAKP